VVYGGEGSVALGWWQGKVIAEEDWWLSWVEMMTLATQAWVSSSLGFPHPTLKVFSA